MPKPIAVAISDLHLTLTAPACRAETDWLEVQARYLTQVKEAAEGLPILCAGDVFDRWNVPPELINFALEHLPTGMVCVPGQHDLPHHRLEDIHRSGYGVLVKAKKIVNISGRCRHWYNEDLEVTGFGWGQAIEPCRIRDRKLQVALIHRYFWATKASCYPGADEASYVCNFKNELAGFDSAVTGDNHKQFVAECGHCSVANPGSFIRRKSDEVGHTPSIFLISENGTFTRAELDIAGDLFRPEVQTPQEVLVDVKAFLDRLENLGEHGLDFQQAVCDHLRHEDISAGAKKIILAALDSHGSTN